MLPRAGSSPPVPLRRGTRGARRPAARIVRRSFGRPWQRARGRASPARFLAWAASHCTRRRNCGEPESSPTCCCRRARSSWRWRPWLTVRSPHRLHSCWRWLAGSGSAERKRRTPVRGLPDEARPRLGRACGRACTGGPSDWPSMVRPGPCTLVASCSDWLPLPLPRAGRPVVPRERLGSALGRHGPRSSDPSAACCRLPPSPRDPHRAAVGPPQAVGVPSPRSALRGGTSLGVGRSLELQGDMAVLTLRQPASLRRRDPARPVMPQEAG